MSKITIKQARETMRKALEDDEKFKIGYVANVAMALYDNPINTHVPKERNALAEKILDLIFN